MANHVGFIVNNVQEQVAKWKAAGVPVLPGTNNQQDQAFVVTPDGVRIEILEDKTQSVRVRNEHVHFSLPNPNSQGPGLVRQDLRRQGRHPQQRRGRGPARASRLRFAKADTAQAPTKGRVLDHIGFDVKDHPAFVKKIEARRHQARRAGPRKSPSAAAPSPTSPIPGAPASRSSNGGRWDRW